MGTLNAPLSGAQARTRQAILTATAAVLGRDRQATVPDIANAAGVGRTTVHRYFADRESLVYEATLDAIRTLNEAVAHAGTDEGPPADAMRRAIAAMVSVGDHILYLYGDPTVLQAVSPRDLPSEDPIVDLIARGQRDGVFDRELSANWIQHTLWALVYLGCQDASSGDLPRHKVTPTIIRTFEHGVMPSIEQEL